LWGGEDAKDVRKRRAFFDSHGHIRFLHGQLVVATTYGAPRAFPTFDLEIGAFLQTTAAAAEGMIALPKRLPTEARQTARCFFNETKAACEMPTNSDQRK
jgi:hypothetical protein